MTDNPILLELYSARSEIMAKYGNDLGAYLRDASERTKASCHPIAEIKQRTIRRTEATKADSAAVASPTSPCRDR